MYLNFHQCVPSSQQSYPGPLSCCRCSQFLFFYKKKTHLFLCISLSSENTSKEQNAWVAESNVTTL